MMLWKVLQSICNMHSICNMPAPSSMGLIEAEDIKKRWQEYIEELYKKIFTTQMITMV